MLINHIEKVDKEDIPIKGGEGAEIQWLIADKQGADKFYMRLVTLEPGGSIPLHSHDIIHEMYVTSGDGAVVKESGEEQAITKGSFVYIPGNEKHGFKNTGEENFEFICCIDKPDKDPYK